MFLTRIGFRSKTVVTGDVSQVDLPKDTKSGLIDCLEFVDKIKGVKISNFDSSDVVRHRIVRDIINAYDKRKNKNLKVHIVKDELNEYIPSDYKIKKWARNSFIKIKEAAVVIKIASMNNMREIKSRFSKIRPFVMFYHFQIHQSISLNLII